MNEAPEITLRREVFRSDVETIAAWMRDSVVTQHLNEEQNVERQLEYLLRNTTLTVLSAQFNINGQFFVINHRRHGPIGFVRLAPRGKEVEIVIVIGDRRQWGKGYGRRALKHGIRHALLNWRKERVVAKIHRENRRSIRIFRNSGFSKRRDLDVEEEFILSIDDFLNAMNSPR